jgi:hypothetical protein
MSAVCVRSLGGLHGIFRRPVRPVRTLVFLLTLAAAALGSHDLKAQTSDAARAEAVRTDQPWCLQRSQHEPPACIFDNFPSCVIAGFKEGGNCISNPGPAAAAPSVDPAQRRRAARPPAASRQQDASAAPQQSAAASAQSAQSAQPAQKRRKLTQAEREKIFSDFQNWRAQRADTKTH